MNTSSLQKMKMASRMLCLPSQTTGSTLFGQVVEKPSDLILCLFGFMKATKIRDSSENTQCVQNVLAKSCLPCQILYKPKNVLLSTERPRYEFSATGLRRICKQWFSQ